MSTGTLKKPSRPPPPPPIHDPYSFNISGNNHHASNSSSSSSSATFVGSRRSNSRLSDYIKISECHTGLLPDRHLQLGTSPFDTKYNTGVGLAGFKNRTSTSFSSATLKPSTNLFSLGTSSPLANHNQYPHGQSYQSSHHKSHSLTENHLNPSFYDLPPYEAQHNYRGNKHHSSTRHSNHQSGGSSNSNHFDKTSGCAHSYFKQQQVDSRKSALSQPAQATDYRQVDFTKTEALNEVINERNSSDRTSGRETNFNRLLASPSSHRRS